MTRQSKFNRQNRARDSDESLLETIINDVVNAADMPTEDWLALSQSPLQTLAIPVSEDKEYHATQVGVEAAYKLTSKVWEERKDYRQKLGRKSFDYLSFHAIGEAIYASSINLLKETGCSEERDEPNPTFYENLAGDFRKILDRLTEEERTNVDQHIPCMLFHEDQSVQAFSVGPVQFLPRTEWIDRYISDREARDIVGRVEQRVMTIDEVRLQALEPCSGRPVQEALTVLAFLKGFSWIGTIRADDHELRWSHRKMSTIVGLAIDALGLLFRSDEARRFTKAGRAHLFSEVRLATLVEDGRIIHGWNVNMPGLGSKPGALVNKIQAKRAFLDAAGELLSIYLRSRQMGTAPHLIEAWVNALYWTGEARREGSDFMAVVKYGCAVDGLSGAGGRSSAIIDFAEAALGPGDADKLPEDELSIAEAVELVYEKGRNKLTHGEMPGVLEDFSKQRRVGDALLVKLFYVVTLVLGKYIIEESSVLELNKRNAYIALKARMRKSH